MSYIDSISRLREAALHPARTAAETKNNTGKELVGCFPIYTPEEIIYAAGAVPIGMWGGKTELKLADRYLQSFCCSIMRTNMEFGLKGTYDLLQAAVIPTLCDTLKCICENWKIAVPQVPAIPVVYPQNRSTSASGQYLTYEFKRFKGELESLLCKIVSDESLNAAWAVYEDYRETMRSFVKIAADYPHIIGAETRHLIIKAGYFMDKAVYTRAVKEILQGLDTETKKDFPGTKAILTGYLAEPIDILRILDENNIAVVGDDLAQASRQFRVTACEAGDVWTKMVWRIAHQEGCSFLFDPEKKRGEKLIKMVQNARADSVILFMMKFCDPEEFDYPIYKKELEAAGIPILYLEVDQQINSFEQFRTRIQSFSEMLI